MDKEEEQKLNMRAAVALGCEYSEETHRWWHYNFGSVESWELKFTTNRDWAMLGVEAVNDKYDKYKTYRGLDIFLDRLAKTLGWVKGLKEYHRGENINSDGQVGELFLASAAQITETWVAILEERAEKDE